eukprot:scaffold205225_cov33-Tisochrysis_lutea.AAC.2
MPMTCDANDMSINNSPAPFGQSVSPPVYLTQAAKGGTSAASSPSISTQHELPIPNPYELTCTFCAACQSGCIGSFPQQWDLKQLSKETMCSPPVRLVQAVKDGGQHSLKARAVAGHVAHWRSAVVQDVAQQEQPAHRCLGSLALCKRSWQVAHKYIRCAQGHADCIDKFIHPQTVTCGRHGGGLSLNYTPDSQSNLVLILARGLTARVI